MIRIKTVVLRIIIRGSKLMGSLIIILTGIGALVVLAYLRVLAEVEALQKLSSRQWSKFTER
jgi:hypothetical protein